MPVNRLRYKLVNGFIDNWLVAGPQEHNEILENPPEESVIDELITTAVEPGSPEDGKFTILGYSGAWHYWRCSEDHLIDFSFESNKELFYSSWAFAELKSSKNRTAVLMLTSDCPVNIWIRGSKYQYFELNHTSRTTGILSINLDKGTNSILVRFCKYGNQPGPYSIAARLCVSENINAPLASVKIQLHTNISHLNRRNEVDQALQAVYTRRDIFSSTEKIEAEWPAKMENKAFLGVRLQTPSGRIFVEAMDKGQPGDIAYLNHSASLNEGRYEIFLSAVPREYYDENIRVERKIPVWVVGNHPYSELDPKSYPERRLEALHNSAGRKADIFAELAKMALGRWKKVDKEFILDYIHTIQSTQKSLLGLLGLLGMQIRFSQEEQYPDEIKQALADTVPSIDGWSMEACQNEGELILLFANKILAGQVFRDKEFKRLNITGEQLRRQGEMEGLAWMQNHARYGFEAWDSDPILTDSLIALSHLVDLAETEAIYDLAGALIDKILIGLAVNSYCGSLAATSGYESDLSIKGIYGKGTTGICRLLWGQGAYNHLVAGYTSLACMESYELPTIIRDLANQKDVVVWGSEKHHNINKVTYRNKHGMLSSVQNYRPGEQGNKEHICQASLGPETVVFVNHPGNASHNNMHTPSFWLGNSSLPKVAQWEDLLIAIYNLPDNDWMGFTHAYFPTYAFDKYLIKKNWVFGQKGDGYIAITASQKLNLMNNGQGAYRELRCDHKQVVWVCQLGNADQDQDFPSFQRKILEHPIEFTQLSLKFKSIRDHEFSFGWNEPFVKNGSSELFKHNLHYEYNHVKADYPCQLMEVQVDENLFRVNFA